MFCPKCRQEYIDGITQCDECNIALVNVLPEEIYSVNSKNIQFEHVLSTSNHADIAFIKSLLDSKNIIYYFQGESTFNVTLYNMIQPARLMVKKENVEKVKELLKDVNIKYFAF
ncbi:MAG: DUF2007 domain-containing protein [bacterium]|nr:DUF2007 domain-containing protein [bacterium]